MLLCVGLSFVTLVSVVAAATIDRVEYDYYKYHPMPEITQWMSQMKNDHPDVVTIVDYGKTYENRTISLLKIGMNTGVKKKAIWVDCGIHAREWIAPAFCQYFVRQILQSYKSDPKMELMVKNMDFYVTPVFNVDGYVYSWKDNTTRLWRKNRTPGPEGCECFGTDLNRNFDANWGTSQKYSFDQDNSSFCCSEVYQGSASVSELETRFLTQFVGNRKKDFLCFFNIHAFSQMILIPYGLRDLTASNYDELMEVGHGAAEAIRKVHGMEYRVGTPTNLLYSAAGSSMDWARMLGIPLTFSFELRDTGKFGFELPDDQIQPACEEAYSGALHIITYAHDKTFNAAAAAAATLWSVMLAVGVTGVTMM